VLERKVRRAEKRQTEERIPMVRVLVSAVRQARGLPRRNVVIPLKGAAG
jgi:hypothetical protein